MNVLAEERQEAVLRALVEGNSMRSTARLAGCSRKTVSRLLRNVGAHCKNYHDRKVTDLPCKRVQADEIWAFVYCKERLATDEDREQGRGSAWTWTALCPDTKLMISYWVGRRDAADASGFAHDLASRLANRVQLTTDGWSLYLHAIEEAFGYGNVDYARLVKTFGAVVEEDMPVERRYSPRRCTGAEKQRVMGSPDPAHISTAHVERANLEIRMGCRRFTRLTNAFSKKLEYHLYAMALHAMHYNFCRPHGTLTMEAGGIRTTPAMAIGLAERPWHVGHLLELLHGNDPTA